MLTNYRSGNESIGGHEEIENKQWSLVNNFHDPNSQQGQIKVVKSENLVQLPRNFRLHHSQRTLQVSASIICLKFFSCSYERLPWRTACSVSKYKKERKLQRK